MFQFAHSQQTPLRQAITEAYRCDEIQALALILKMRQMSEHEQKAASSLARRLVTQVRESRSKSSGVDALMHEFTLSSNEGIALMCLAEALLRIPDNATRSKLIKDKLTDGNWKSHLGNSPSLFVNAVSWGLLITGKLVNPPSEENLSATLTRFLSKVGEPIIRQSIGYAMRILGKQFVTGQTIKGAIKNGKEREKLGYRFSFDMLGEAAMTQSDANRYYQDYINAIHIIGKDAKNVGVYEGNGISVKLSAIHPRYSRAQHHRVMQELLPKLKGLFLLAKQYDIGLNIDAEEANRLDLSLDLMEALVSDSELAGFNGIGFVVQSYQKRCPFIIDFLVDLARRNQQKLMIRLVKGAYWDSEIKWAQLDGMEGYPVYTRKVHTDISYLACARKLLDAQDAIFPQFATHNAYTLAAIYQMGEGKEFEFQCLHGMGETLYNQVVGETNLNRRVRIYAPVGTHETLLAYLVRRLLENGANSSFVNQIVDEKISIEQLIRNPFDSIEQYGIRLHQALPMPNQLYGKTRLNSKGIDFSNENTLQELQYNLNQPMQANLQISSIINGEARAVAPIHEIKNPADHNDIIGTASFADAGLAQEAITHAIAAYPTWSNKSATERSKCLRHFADLMEEHSPKLMMLAVREAGKTLNNAISEVREAVDFCRYYAIEAESTLPLNTHGLGAIVAISPWNFPLAIFVGEVVAALAAGNTVIAKPAEQTSLIAHYAVTLLHQAGVPVNALQLILGEGNIGAALTQDHRISGVIFTGSTEVARLINQSLANRADNPVLIAETGGQNAMIVDSSALPEQVVADVLSSAFDSAGQRCSALRILCLQENIADHFISMIKGAMNELQVGNPCQLSSDVGPVIDAEAQDKLQKHIDKFKNIAKDYHQVELAEINHNATFIAPIMFELNNLDELQHEVFGPVLHIVRYRAEELDTLIEQINHKGYALTHGIHSRIEQTVKHICSRIEAGNIYINRNIVGAVVGVQPFGGHGLSGTGPKAGGPFYIQRLSALSHWQIPKLSRIGQADETTLNRLQEILQTLAISQEQKLYLAGKMGQARVHTLRQAELILSGPTGERNSMSWQAPEKVWLYGSDLISAFAALIELAASGIQSIITPNHPLIEYAESIKDWIICNVHPESSGISHVIALEPLSIECKQSLARQNGALIHIIPADKGLDILQVYKEISYSVNTTAAGGNANLIAVSDI